MLGHFSNLRALLMLAILSAQSITNGAGVVHAPQTTVPDTTASLTLATTTNRSLNWSGYMAKGDAFSEVSGTWIVPAVIPGPYVAADATWVGIGGVGSRNLIQAGTQAIVDEAGNVEYESWIEGLPGNSVTVPLAVSPGDTVTVDLHEDAPGSWRIDLHNDTTGKDYATTIPYDSTKGSAEWIEEMPTADMYIPLDNFDSVHFTSAFAVENGATVTPAQAKAQALSMVNLDGDLLALPSVLDASGSAFRVARLSPQ